MTTPRPRALIVGAERAFGAEISAGLSQRGFDTVRASPGGIEAALASGGAIDALIVNAPVTLPNVPFAEISDADFDAAMQDLLYDTVSAGQAALPFLRRGGAIVHVGSRGYLGAWGGAHLMAASAALAAMTRCMALELADEGISVNHVAAGFAGTPWDTPQARAQVAQAACMLCEPGTGLAGQTLIVDGGRSLRMSESRRR